jgi:hypothetical protein
MELSKSWKCQDMMATFLPSQGHGENGKSMTGTCQGHDDMTIMPLPHYGDARALAKPLPPRYVLLPW